MKIRCDTDNPSDFIIKQGRVFIVVKKAFWNQGLGRILLEEAVDWAENGSSLRRLELTVQVRNERAVHLYKEFF